MKNILIALGMLFILIAPTGHVLAQNSDNSEFALCKYTLSELATGNHNDEPGATNNSGMTCKQVYDLLNAYTMEFAGVDLPTFVKEGQQSPLTEKHANTQAYPNGIQAFIDRTPSGHMRSLKNGRLKEECCNILGTETGTINNFLASYAKQSQDQGSEPKHKIGDGPSNQPKQETINNNEMNTGWIILALILGLGVIAAIIAIILNARGNRANDRLQMEASLLAARQAVIADQTAFQNFHYAGVNQFLGTARQMNSDGAANAGLVAQTLRQYANPPAPAANANTGAN